MGRNGQPMGLRPWRSSAVEPKENGLENDFSDPAITPDEPKSEPLPVIPSLLPADNGLKKNSILHRQQSLVILTGKTRRHTHPYHTHILSWFIINVFLQSQSKIKTCPSPLWRLKRFFRAMWCGRVQRVTAPLSKYWSFCTPLTCGQHLWFNMKCRHFLAGNTNRITFKCKLFFIIQKTVFLLWHNIVSCLLNLLKP